MDFYVLNTTYKMEGDLKKNIEISMFKKIILLNFYQTTNRKTGQNFARPKNKVLVLILNFIMRF